jgi:hypothetical protein
MPNAREIPLAKLRLDTSNPRLDDGRQSQRDALTSMMQAQEEKLVVLARDIVKNGLSPIDRFLVTPAEDNADEFIVLEGNRRITALKLLANPTLGNGVLRNSDVAKLKELAHGSQFDENSEIDCIIVSDRDEANHWLRLRHGGALEGMGVVNWGATERERFEARSGEASPELQVLSLLTGNGVITPEEADNISITSLRRLLSDKDVRSKLGIEIDRKNRKVSTHFPINEVLKGLGKVAHEMASDDFRVGKIYHDSDRKTFMSKFKAANLPNPKTRLPAAVELGASAPASAAAAASSPKKGGGRVAKHRATVAPTNLRLKIPQAKIRDIYRELQQLKLEKYANAGAVLLRVFGELTADHYIKKHKLSIKAGAELKTKLQLVHDDLETKGVMTRNELAPIRKAISDPGLPALSISTFNLYVHSYDLTPSPRDVRTAWDNLQLFFERIWQ